MPYKKTRRLRYAPRRLRKPPPFQKDHELKNISLGIALGEGYTMCHNRSPALGVSMCDEKAVQIVSKAWGTGVHQGKTLCKPTPENPEGRIHITEASGTRAEAIMKGYEPHITGTELHKKWLAKKETCAKRTLKRVRRRP